MRGSVGSQMTRLLREVYAVGQSKYADKKAVRVELAAVGKTATSEAIAEKTDIYSLSTTNNFLIRWI